ncbi:hypothetical protein [Micromonospora purpureochromogenes]|uniref:DivIVA domain-containing protein n=1 Tax=Micromonospora purpureochromogenes TaxID=47872 RepID=A0ABX2RDI9_9ACTN|nr:hypothetical protein [Micromonospora purpureochromogenes]NYF54562.1 hypothetical protein [Micromonospora purpureochromogenes]
MELHRRPGRLLLPAICILAGIFLLTLGDGGGLLRALVALGGIALGVVVLVGALRPFRFVVDADGLTVRRPGLRRTIRWPELAAVVLDQPAPRSGVPAAPRLLAVPADGTTLGPPLEARHPVDDRPAVELLDLAPIRESPAEIAGALARYAGDRFVDARAQLQAAFPDPDFAYCLRGYRTEPVDALIRRGREALISADPARRRVIRAEIVQARADGLRRDNRGYESRQVDEALDALDAALAAEPSEREPS